MRPSRVSCQAAHGNVTRASASLPADEHVHRGLACGPKPYLLFLMQHTLRFCST